jgi:hypothetical protein
MHRCLTDMKGKAFKGIYGFRKLLVCAWLWEASAVFVILSLYRMESEPNLQAFASRLGFKLLLAAFMLFACSSLLVGRYYSALRKEDTSPFKLLLRWNILPLIVVITVAEAALRLYSTDTVWGTLLMGQPLGPRRLAATSYFHTPREARYYDEDELLGWSAKPNLRSGNGLYNTGDRGMRVSEAGTTASASRGSCRIALVGDSHTFGEELKFEETWAYLLKDYLSQQCQILNFGVGGHSVGQIYLRYIRDVRPSDPDMVIFSLSSHTAARTMGVYGLNMFPSDRPWAQPRFELRDRGVTPINLPLPSLTAIANARSMSDLPYIDYDRFYVPGNWELPRWRLMYNSYLFRLYVSWFPLWRSQHSGNSTEAVNHALLRSFLQTVQSDGARSVVLYFPDPYEYEEPDREMPSRRILRTSGIEYFDLRPCLDQIPAEDRFIPNGEHYSMKASIAVARCVAQSPQFKANILTEPPPTNHH